MLLRVIGFLALSWTFATPAARACSCIMQRVCHVVKLHDAMFVGKVLSVRTATEPAGGFAIRRRIFRFSVVETFAGKQRNGEEIEVETGSGGGDCGYNFVAGERYLVDANPLGAVLVTGICSATAPEPLAMATIRALRLAAGGGRQPDVMGEVVSVERQDYSAARVMAGVPVTLIAKTDGAKYRAVTDSDGVYSIATLPPDVYTVEADLPPNRTTGAIVDGKPFQIEIPQVNGTGAGCRLDIHAEPAGGITGRAVDAEGNGIAGFVSAYPAGYTGWPGAWIAASGTEPDGTFHLYSLAEGRYRIEFMKNGAEKGTWYYPAGHDVSAAGAVQVTDGKTTQDIRIIVK